MTELEGILKFIKLTHDFQKIERINLIKGEERYENDVEHSYQLALIGWYIVSSQKLDLNIDRVIQYSLLHDLVEVYAGDTYAFDADVSVHESKVERERLALVQLKEEFSEFPEMTNTIEQYEQRLDEESKFVYALDKIIPPLNMYLDGGRTWQRHSITLDQIIENKTPKVAVHPEIQKYFEQIVALLKSEQDQLWPKPNE
ncbi:MAG: HD domain-containing protein [bacterium]|nr:HD domain-containing protein [bacterium]